MMLLEGSELSPTTYITLGLRKRKANNLTVPEIAWFPYATGKLWHRTSAIFLDTVLGSRDSNACGGCDRI